MAVIPVSRMLFELGMPASAAANEGEKAAVARRCINCRSEEEVRTEVENAHARGVAEGRERGRSERIQSEQQMRDSLAEEQDARLAALAHEAVGRIDAGIERLRAETSSAVAQALVGFFQGKIELEAIETLAADVRDILAEKGAARVAIRGPQSWIDRLVVLPEVANGSVKVEVQVSDAIDVTLNIDGTILETSIAQWLAGLRRGP